MENEIIVVEELRHSYRHSRESRPAVDDLSFRVRPGEIFGLLGPNGAGKTTAVKILTTILRPTGGRAFIAGHDVAREPLQARRQLAAVLQESAVETLLSVRDNLLLYARLHGYRPREIGSRMRNTVDLLELGPYLSERAQALSGGYKRRLQVAKALMVDTPVLFLDEATSGMDPLIKRRVMGALHEQATQGRTVVLTTQLLDEAEALCDRMILMNHGRAIATGKLSELRVLAHRMFRINLSFQAGDPAAVQALHGLGAASIEEEDGEFVLTVEGSEGDWIGRMARVAERWPLSHLEIRGPDLEQIFLAVYGEGEAGGRQNSQETPHER